MCSINRRAVLRSASLTAAAAGSSAALGACSGDSGQGASTARVAIANARIFDGEQVLDQHCVLIEGGSIVGITGVAPSDASVVDAAGATLLPGLIDSHVHTSEEGLRDALLFGVTTELEMQGGFDAEGRKAIAGRDDLADVRSAGFGLTAPGGHPSELVPEDGPPGDGADGPPEGESGANPAASEVTTPEEAVRAVRTRVDGGSDFIKFMIEDGHVLGAPDLPMMSDATVRAGVLETRRLGKLAVAHTLTVAATEQALAAGMNGLAHLFIDRPHTREIVEAVVRSGAFVTPCLCLNASIMGRTGAELAADPRVGPRLGPEWLATLNGSLNRYPQGDFDAVLATAGALHAAGVDLLVGTDVSVAWPELGGMAHGASVHHEMQLLVKAGLTPIAALRAATSVPARRFGLTDRGRIAPGARADLVLVGGDPTTNISDSLSIKEVWRRGVRLAR
ncbi:amidohydrolase family protein [Amycolatopsis magusensis]|uniref:amidohydrolase family protein n=1 Tax=Amycolatopsis magusensis TaxID=882444 RepID=UPI0024A9889C|nr:amidohydrolase family protein [Amycolatopsis magusensis]MDI5975702.1 amidohydrolase family protein [Amycolatopsis magusensis]